MYTWFSSICIMNSLHNKNNDNYLDMSLYIEMDNNSSSYIGDIRMSLVAEEDTYMYPEGMEDIFSNSCLVISGKYIVEDDE